MQARQVSKKSKRKDKWFDKKDTNSDGKISKEEALTFAKQKFAKIDSNKDGNIAKEEAQTYRSARAEKRAQKRQNK